jgi:GNAT superfamily N-acetyltransferase
MSDSQAIIIRPMSGNDILQAAGLSKAEGWNQTDADWHFLLTTPENICLVADDGRKIAGTATATVHSPKIAWIGMVLVDRNMRGFGIGKRLMTSLIDALKHIECIKLDATPAGRPLYLKLGFKDEYQIFRMINPLYDGCATPDSDIHPEALRNDQLKDVLKLDEKIFGSSRSGLLADLFNNNPEKAFVITKNDKPEGYVLGRRGLRYNYIGPVCSFTSKAAVSLITAALKELAGTTIAIDIPEDKKEVISWLESTGFEIQRSFMRMYLNNNSIQGELNHQYLISGPEYG